MRENHPFCIYGAGIVATGVYTAVKTLYHKEPLFFLVSDAGEQDKAAERIPEEIDGVTVKALSVWEQELQAQTGGAGIGMPAYYLIATPEIHHAAIMASLCSIETIQIEREQIILVTNELENKLMEAYYRSLSGTSGCTTVLSLLAGHGKMQKIWKDSRRCEVFQVRSHMDKPLSGQLSYDQSLYGQPQHSCLADSASLCGNATESGRDRNLSYIQPIQAGAALTDQKIAECQDNQDDNISAKNRNYCELTATYYVWKNSHAAYKGICHYRRIFDISEKQMQKLLEREQEWDVILPYPSVQYPDISVQHTRYLKEKDWNAMIQALKETAPEYLDAYENCIAEGKQFFQNFNMLIAKAEVFDDYCNFLFPVLARAEELTEPKGWERADRFAGYMGENLTTIYFYKNKDKLKIAYAGKVWLT